MYDECMVDGCKLRDGVGGWCMFERNRADGLHPLSCEYGRFCRTMHDEFGGMDGWKLFEYASGAVRASLRGSRGTVEVWGGAHRHEVWFVERGTKAEAMLCEEWGVTDGSLRDAVERAYAMAGVQVPLAL